MFLRIAGTAVVGIVVLTLGLSSDFYNSAMISAFFSLALASSLIVFLFLSRSVMDLLWVVTGAAFLAMVDLKLLHFQFQIMSLFSFVGLSSVFFFVKRTIWAEAEERKIFLYAIVPTLLFVASDWMASPLLQLTAKLHPKTFDLFLYSFDCSLRVQLSFLMGAIFSKWLWFRFVCILFYIALPMPLGLVYAARLYKDKQAALPVAIAFVITGPLGILCYNLLPGTGPIHLFGPNFPFHPLTIEAAKSMVLEALPIKGARNAIPSLHMTWVLLAWWSSRGTSKVVRAVALAFVIFTVFATLGMGEHYFVDLVVAFPFALAVQALSQLRVPHRQDQRRAGLLCGVFVTLFWLATLSFATRMFWVSPVLPWAVVLGTVITACALQRRMEPRQSAAPAVVYAFRAAASSGD